ncbi:hypothetical protein WEI85_37430 [Actinomycetes bacterium KLBMP 9797]
MGHRRPAADAAYATWTTTAPRRRCTFGLARADGTTGDDALGVFVAGRTPKGLDM